MACDMVALELAEKVGGLQQLQSLELHLWQNSIEDAGRQALRDLEAARSSQGLSTTYHNL